MLGRDAAAGRAAGLHGLDRPLGRAAADLLDDLAEGRPHRHLDEPGVADLAGQGEDLGPLALLGADRGEPIAAPPDDRRDVGERFDVVDQCRAAPETLGRRIGRARPGHAAQALDRVRSARSPRRRRTRRHRCGCRSGNRTAIRRSGCPSSPYLLACLIAVSSRRMASGYSPRT